MAVTFGSPLVCPVMVGRDACIEAIDRTLDEVRAGRGQTLLISGEAGIGKSRLIAALRARATSAGVFQGSCFERDRSLPYAPVVDALRTLASGLEPVAALHRLGPDLAALLPELGMARDTGDDPEQAQQRVRESLVQLLTDMASQPPLLVVFEDLHWSDAASLAVFGVLARRLRGVPVLLVGSYRDDEEHAGLANLLAQLERARLSSELHLDRLGADDVEDMLRAIAGSAGTIRSSLFRRLFDLTDGNPFFVEEVVRSLFAVTSASSAQAWEQVPLNELRLPRTVHDAVQRRTDRLSPTARQLVVLAAIAGRRFQFPLLQQLTELDESALLAAIKELITAQLVVEESADTFAFRHALTRQAIHAQLLARERREIHRRIATVLEQQWGEERIEDLAHHFFEAGDWPKAADYGERAGRRAQALHATAAAVTHFSMAIDALKNGDQGVPGRLYRERALAYETLGSFDAALADHQASLALAQTGSDTAAECQAFLDLGFLWAARDYVRTGDCFRRALALARTLDQPVALASALNRVGNWHTNVEQPAQAAAFHREALSIFESLDDRRGVAQTLDLLALATCFGGDQVEAIALYDRAIALHREFDDGPALCSSLSVRSVAGGGGSTWNLSPTTPDSARDALPGAEAALRLARDIGLRAAECFAGHCLAQAASGRGAYSRALEVAYGCLELSDTIAHQQWSCALNFVIGTLLRDLGALDAARPYAEQSLALANTIGSLYWTRTVGAALIELRVSMGKLVAAGALAASLLGESEEPSTNAARHVRFAQARLAFARGDSPQAMSMLKALRTTGTTPTLDLLFAEVLLAQGNASEAEVALHNALVLAEETDQRAIVWRLQAMLARAHQALGRHAEAQRVRKSAERLVLTIASDAPEALRIGYVQSAQRVIGVPAHRAPRDRAGLTAREREVAILIGAGMSNRAIAERLVVGERTIESHVSTILGKLQLANRSRLAAWIACEDSPRTLSR